MIYAIVDPNSTMYFANVQYQRVMAVSETYCEMPSPWYTIGTNEPVTINSHYDPVANTFLIEIPMTATPSMPADPNMEHKPNVI